MIANLLILDFGQYICLLTVAFCSALLEPHCIRMNGDTDSPDAVIQLVHIPRQNLFIPNAVNMKAILSSQPPMGQITTTSKSSTRFTVQLEVDVSREDDQWEVLMWYSTNGSCSWEEYALTRALNEISQSLQLCNSSSRTLYYTADLPSTVPINFTFKFRNAEDQSWKWVQDSQGIADGVVLPKLAAGIDVSPDLRNYIKGMDPTLKVQTERSQAPQTTLWSVTAPVAAAEGSESTFKDIKIGLPFGKFVKYVVDISYHCTCFPAVLPMHTIYPTFCVTLVLPKLLSLSLYSRPLGC